MQWSTHCGKSMWLISKQPFRMFAKRYIISYRENYFGCIRDCMPLDLFETFFFPCLSGFERSHRFQRRFEVTSEGVEEVGNDIPSKRCFLINLECSLNHYISTRWFMLSICYLLKLVETRNGLAPKQSYKFITDV